MAGRSMLNGEHTESFPRSRAKSAPGCTVTSLVAVSAHPRSSVAVSVTVNVSEASPAKNTILGLISLEASPFPKFQSKASAFELLLPNWLTNGSHPLSKSVLNSATGCGLMKTSVDVVPVQPFSVCAENVTVAAINSPVLFSQVCDGVASLEVFPSPKSQVMFSTPSKAGMVKVKGEQTESIPKLRSTTAAGKTVTAFVAVSVHPNAWVTVNVMSNSVFSPLVVNCSVAFSVAAVWPLPKSQENESARLLSLMKFTASGSHPESMSVLKSAVGEGFTCNKATAIPPQPNSVSASKVMMDATAASVSFSQTWVGPFSVDVVPSPKFQSKL